MGDGLKSSSGGAMKNALAKVTNKPVMGFLLGMLVACIIRGGKALIPGGLDSLHRGDHVIVVTTEQGLDDIGDILE